MLLLACALALLTGCGPSLRSLVDGKHYREAICAARDGSDADREAVLRALDADAELRVHVRVASPDELRPILRDATDGVSARARVAEVRAQRNALPLDAVALEAAFETDRDELAALPVSWDSLAWATQEKLPPRRTEETYLTGENVLKAGAALLTGGLSLLFGGGFSPGLVAVDAPTAEYERTAPRASALGRAIGRGGCRDLALAGGAPGGARAGTRCAWYFVVDNTSRAPVSLEIRARYIALRPGGELSDTTDRGLRRRCTLERAARVPLGAPQTLEATSGKLFGGRMRAPRDVASLEAR